MKRMAKVFGVGIAGVLLAAAGGCEFVLRTEPDPTLWSPGGGGQGTTSSGSGTETGGSGGASACTPGEQKACYSGPAGTEEVGLCKAGKQTCLVNGSGFGVCNGEVVPDAETCAGTDDEDCDGHDCVQWVALFGDGQDQQASAVAVDAKGNSFVVGTFKGAIEGQGTSVTAAASSGFLMKLDPKGKPVWAKKIDEGADTVEYASVAVDGQGDVIVGGGSGTGGATVLKFDTSGQLLWSKALSTGSARLGWVRALALTPEGDIAVVGSFHGTVDFGDGDLTGAAGAWAFSGFVGRLRGSDGSGKVADGGWGKVVCGDGSSCFPHRVGVDQAGSVVFAGAFTGDLNLASGAKMTSKSSPDIFLARLSAQGVFSWQRQLGSSGTTFAWGALAGTLGLAVAPTGEATVSGSFGGNADFGGGVVAAATGGSGFLVQYDGSNHHKWSTTFEGGAAATLAIDAWGDVFLAGNYAGTFDLGKGPIVSAGAGGTFVGKFWHTGSVAWARGYDSGTPSGIAALSGEDPVVVGGVKGPVDFGLGTVSPQGGTDAFVVKLSR